MPKNLLQIVRYKILVICAVVIIVFLFFVPIVPTIIPPPTTHTNCGHCMPYIAESVYGSITYLYFGIGGIFPGDWGNWLYYSVYLG